MVSRAPIAVIQRKGAKYFTDININYSQDFEPVVLENLRALDNQIIHILSTPFYTREFEPEFGSRIPEMLFEPVDEITGWLMRTAAYEALTRWMVDQLGRPRITINLNSTFFTPNEDDYAYTGQIVYQELLTGMNANLSLRLPGLRG